MKSCRHFFLISHRLLIFSLTIFLKICSNSARFQFRNQVLTTISRLRKMKQHLNHGARKFLSSFTIKIFHSLKWWFQQLILSDIHTSLSTFFLFRNLSFLQGWLELESQWSFWIYSIKYKKHRTLIRSSSISQRRRVHWEHRNQSRTNLRRNEKTCMELLQGNSWCFS